MVALALIGSLLGTVWWNGLIDAQKSDNVFIYNKSAVIIKELNQYYHRQLKLTHVPGIPLRDSVIGIYQFNSSCDRLPTDKSIIRWHKSNVSGDQNYTHQYLMPGSTLNYTISSVNRDSVSPLRVADSVTHLDAELEKVKGYIYITRGPERQEFDSTNCRSTSDCNIEYEKLFMYDQHGNSYVVDPRAWGYYNFHSAHIVSQYRYTLDLVINATTVDQTKGKYVCNISDVDEREKNCTVNIDFEFKANSLVCLVAHVENEGSSYIILNVEVTRQLMGILLTSVLPPAVVLLTTFVCLISFTIIKFCHYCHCRRPNRYVPVNVQA